MRTRAFTLIELVVVLFFMIMAAALAIPRFAAFQRAGQARDAARNVLSLVREARELAIERQRPVTMEANSSSRSVELRYDDTLLPQIDAGDASSGNVMTVGEATDAPPRPPLFFPEPLTADIQIANQTMSAGSPNGLTFTPDGRAPDADIMVIYAPDRAIRVTVRQQATRVRIENGDALDSSPLGVMP